MAIFSFYLRTDTMENFQIMMAIVVNTLVAIFTTLGLIGIRKKIPLLVRIWSDGLVFFLVYWFSYLIWHSSASSVSIEV